MIAFHFVFRATGGQQPFKARDHFLLMWDQLSKRLERCLGLVLMPNHGHLLVPQEDYEKAKRAIHLSLMHFKRLIPTLWDDVPEPSAIPDKKHLLRQVRYVHLNPCRSNLARDPLAWEFSTHWDYLGYSVGPISVPTVHELGFGTKEQFHRFVSSDPTSNVTGTPMPAHVPFNGFPIVTLDRVADLALGLTRHPPHSLKKPSLVRRLFYSLANAAGYKNKSQMARYLKLSQQGVSASLRRGAVHPYPEDQARRLLCDPRMRKML